MLVVMTLGGNALVRRHEPLEAETQQRNLVVAVAQSVAPIARRHQVVITHRNGPQIGLLALQAAAYALSLLDLHQRTSATTAYRLKIVARQRSTDMRDLELRHKVLAELEYDPSVDAANIGVMVNEGVVTVTGHVSSYAQKVAAERAVRRVKGVRAIAEEIEIRLPREKKTSDDEIAKRAANILRWDSQVPKDAIEIMVQDGWVTLSGTVEWQFQRTAAVSDVYKLSGVAGVNNHIKIRSRVQAADIQNRIEDALKRNAEVEAEGINVTVRDGAVTLTGFVHDLAEHDAIKNAAWSAPGVQSVEDQLRFSD